MTATFEFNQRNWPNRGAAVRGSALIITVMAVAVLCLIAGTLLSWSVSKQSGPFQAASWHEAGSAAEGGVEIALNALRRSINEGSAAWAGWEGSSSPSPTPIPSASPSASPTATPFAKKYLTESDLLSHEGEGNNAVRAIVEISIPTGTGTINPTTVTSERRSYLIRSTGFANVPGPTRLAVNKSDLALRKLNVFRDFRTNATVAAPQITRVVEAIASPKTPFPTAIMSREQLDIKRGKSMIVDSYEPSLGAYSFASHRSYGNIASNGKKNDIIRLENVTVYGGAAKGSGTVNIKSNASVTGEIIDGFYQELKPVQSPRIRTDFSPLLATPSADRPDPNTINIEAGKGPNGAFPAETNYYKFSKIHLHDGEILKIKKGSIGGGYAEIWVTGDIVIHKGGRIEVEDQANVTFYVEKNVTLEEKDSSKPAIKNLNVMSTGATDPSAVQFYGVIPNRTKKHFKIKTNMSAVIYAPDHEFEVKLKAGRHIYGALTGRKFTVEGETQIHYDESLADKGKIYDYTLESWQEDWFDPNVRLGSTGP